MKFSVVIPAFNATELADAIQSCLEQTYRPHEVIVVDDASTEHPAERLKSRFGTDCESGLLTFVSLSRNSGPSTARNIGWDRATGDFVAFLDADDIWDREKLSIVKTWLDAVPHIDWLAHRYRDKDDDRAAQSKPPSRLSLGRLLVANPAQTSCVVLRRSITARFDKRMRYCEDYDLWLRIVASGYRSYVFADSLTRLGRPQRAAGGLSGNHRAMRRGEMLAYIHVSRIRQALSLILPILLVFSMCKHLRKLVSETLRKRLLPLWPARDRLTASS